MMELSSSTKKVDHLILLRPGVSRPLSYIDTSSFLTTGPQRVVQSLDDPGLPAEEWECIHALRLLLARAAGGRLIDSSFPCAMMVDLRHD
jgi:hypothetical protein